MQLSAVLLARVLGFVESVDLNPRGKFFLPDAVPQIVERYKFQQFPRTIEQFDESKGIEFLGGRLGEITIDKFVIWNNLIVVETRSDTKDSKYVLEEMLAWGAEKFKLNYESGKIKRFGYISDVSFFTEVPILSVSPALVHLAERASKSLSEIWQEPVQYHPLNLVVGHDPTSRKYPIAPFSITRRAEARFDENKYYSEAPLPTELHLEFLKNFEVEVMRIHEIAKQK